MASTATQVRLTIDINEELEPQLESLISDELMALVAERAGVIPQSANYNDLRQGLITACKEYVGGAGDYENQRTEKQDNEALDRVTRSAQNLYDALLALQEHPGVEPRIEASVRQNNRLHKLPTDIDLSELIGSRRNIFADIRELLVDLEVCTEAVINRKPKPDLIEPFNEDDEPFSFETESEFEDRVQTRRETSRKRKIPKDHPLREFLAAFKPVWESVSDYPFTEGMHYSEIGTTTSRLVDCVETVLNTLAPGTRRSEIVTTLRKMRRESE